MWAVRHYARTILLPLRRLRGEMTNSSSSLRSRDHGQLIRALNDDSWPCQHGGVKLYGHRKHAVAGKVYFENNQHYPSSIAALVLNNSLECHIIINANTTNPGGARGVLLGNYRSETVWPGTKINLVPVSPRVPRRAWKYCCLAKKARRKTRASWDLSRKV